MKHFHSSTVTCKIDKITIMTSIQERENSSRSYSELINSTKSKPKISIDSFLYIRDENCYDLYYWVRQRKRPKEMKCIARTVTIRVGNQHKIRKFDVTSIIMLHKRTNLKL